LTPRRLTPLTWMVGGLYPLTVAAGWLLLRIAAKVGVL
jgi:hypothetical protein